MAVPPLSRVGSFEITSLLGRGGMGEVYRAHDNRLNRDVAVKLLPESFARDPQRMLRFEREAQVLASLNHPGIAAIYGLEESNSVRALVMELVEGPTLDEQLKKGRMPLDEVLSVSKQIAEALEFAHERGIVHRDLKPSNVKILPSGEVKVLDFGLAKAASLEPEGVDAGSSPTLTAVATEAGLLLGTAAYMSPEQARGKPVDRRADIWAFGVVLYEMLTGKQLFAAETVTDTLASVLRNLPDLTALPNSTPQGLVTLLSRCLEKDPKQRLRDIGEARIAIEALLDGTVQQSPTGIVTKRRRIPTNAGRMLAAISVAALIVAFIAILWHGRGEKENRTVRFDVFPPEHGFIGPTATRAMAVSPDGNQIVYRVLDATGARLYVRDVASFLGKPILGTEGANMPFFSPDGQSVAFFAANQLKRVSISGGDASIIADVAQFSGISGGTWSSDQNIYVANADTLYSVAESGGAWRTLLRATDEKQPAFLLQPQALPSGKALVLAIGQLGTLDEARIVAVRTDTMEQRTLIQGGTDPHFVSPNYLVYMRQGTLMAVPFDATRLELRGTPVAVLEGVFDFNLYGVGEFDVSLNGTLSYMGGEPAFTQLHWRNRAGDVQPIPVKPNIYLAPRLSPDGKSVALAVWGRSTVSNTGIWIYDLDKGTLRRMTFGPGEDESAVWSPEGKRIAYSANGRHQAFWFPVDGSHPEESLMTWPAHFHLYSWSPDGKFIAFESGTLGKFEIWILPLFGDRKPYPFLRSMFNARTPVFSPDGHWLAYSSNESGQAEVYVQRFPGPGERIQVSTDGGIYPAWARDGHSLFYENGNKLMAASVTTTPTFSATKPRELFQIAIHGVVNHRSFDPSPDGKRFVVVERSSVENSVNPVHVVLNWTGELSKHFKP